MAYCNAINILTLMPPRIHGANTLQYVGPVLLLPIKHTTLAYVWPSKPTLSRIYLLPPAKDCCNLFIPGHLFCTSYYFLVLEHSSNGRTFLVAH